MKRIKKAKAFIYHYKEHLLSLSFVFGFIVDNLTLRRVDNVLDNLILAGYTTLMMVVMLVFYAALVSKFPERISNFFRTYGPFAMQFAFGGLLSGILVFYSRSGTWISSWPFLLIVIGVILGNELLQRREDKLIFNCAVLFVGLFSYMELIVPIIIGRMGDVVFVFSSVMSLAVFIVFFKLLMKIIPHFALLHLRSVVCAIGLLFVLMQVLYFTNIIPPIPLSMKDMGIYHSVQKLDDGRYAFSYEKQPWYRFWQRHEDAIFTDSSEYNPYCYTAIFAPTKLTTNIYHEWDYYDETIGAWVLRSKIFYTIQGGRGEGYRGYSFIKNYTAGKWRCRATTERGQVIGETKFFVRENIQDGEPVVVDIRTKVE